MDPQEPIKVYDAWNSQQARMLCQHLLDAGIDARVASDAMETLSGKVPFQLATCPVWVAAVDAPQAMTIVEDFDQRLTHRSFTQTVRDEPYCYHCGEAITAKQPSCPKCGGELEWIDTPVIAKPNMKKFNRDWPSFLSGIGIGLLCMYVLAQAVPITLDGLPRIAVGGTAVVFMAIGGVGEFRRRSSTRSKPQVIESDSQNNS